MIPDKYPVNHKIILHVDATFDFEKNIWIYGNNKEIKPDEWFNIRGQYPKYPVMNDIVTIRSRNPLTTEFTVVVGSSTDYLTDEVGAERKLAICQHNDTAVYYKSNTTLSEARHFCGKDQLFYPQHVSQIPSSLANEVTQPISEMM